MNRLAERTIVEQAVELWNRRKWLALIAFVVVLAAASSVVTYLPAIYQSTATVLVERRQVAETFVRSSVTGELETRLHTIGKEILSRARLADLITRFDLYRDLRKKASAEAVVEKMRGDIEFETKGAEQMSGRRATIAFTISYRGRDPDTVARVTNTLASFYVEENVKLRDQQAAGTAEFLRTQLADMKQRLAGQERRVREYRTLHVGELPQQMAVNLATVERLHAQLHLNSANQLRAIDRRAAIAKQLTEASQSSVLTTPDTTASQIAKLRQELMELRRRFSDKYPEVIRIKETIAALERELVETKPRAATDTEPTLSFDPTVRRLQSALGETESEVEALKAEEQRLRRDIAAYQRRIENAPQREQEFQELARDYETTRELHASLLKRYEDAHLAESMEQLQRGEQFRILDPALPAKQPVAPDRQRLFVIGLMLSFGMAGAVVLLAERLDTSFHTVDDLKSLGNVPVLVSIPLVIGERDRRWRRCRWAFTAAVVTLLIGLVVKATQYVADGNELLVRLLARTGA